MNLKNALFLKKIAYIFLLISIPRIILRKKELGYYIEKVNIS